MDVTVYALTMQEVLQWAKEGMGDEKPRLIATANAEMIMQAQEDKELGRILNRADLVVPDGAGVLWAGETLGTPFPERVTRCRPVCRAAKDRIERRLARLFLGRGAGVAKKAADRFQKSHGEIRLVGCHDGYFDEEEEKRIIKDIRKSGAKLLLVGLGVPKQEKWLYRHKDELGPVLAMGIGGVFDVMSGNLKRAPLWMQKNRLEWAYRLYLQPSRIGRMMAIPKFMMAVKKWKKEQGGRG